MRFCIRSVDKSPPVHRLCTASIEAARHRGQPDALISSAIIAHLGTLWPIPSHSRPFPALFQSWYLVPNLSSMTRFSRSHFHNDCDSHQGWTNDVASASFVSTQVDLHPTRSTSTEISDQDDQEQGLRGQLRAALQSIVASNLSLYRTPKLIAIVAFTSTACACRPDPLLLLIRSLLLGLSSSQQQCRPSANLNVAVNETVKMVLALTHHPLLVCSSPKTCTPLGN